MLVVDTVSTDLSSTQWFIISSTNMEFIIALTVLSINFLQFFYPMRMFCSDTGIDNLFSWDYIGNDASR